MTLEEMRAREKALLTEKRGLFDSALAEQRALNDTESTRQTAIDEERSTLTMAIEDRKADATRTAEQDEARKAAGLTQTIDARVISEPRTYSLEGEHSYMKDLVVTHPTWQSGGGSKAAAEARLAHHNYEVAVEVASDTAEGRSAANVIRQENREQGAANGQIAELRSRGKAGQSEIRALTTGSGSGGAFAPPVYLLDLYAPFRTAGRAFIDSLQSKPLPSSGMTIDIPAMGNAAAVTTQSSQNSGVGEGDPNAAYISANVGTIAGEITVSQQLLDRTGPWDGSYDAVMFDQLTRIYNTQADIYALTASLAGAGAVAYPSTLSVADTYLAVNGAQSIIRSTAGVFRNPTAAFMTPTRWSWLASQVDSEGRPLIVPNAQSPMNAVMAGGDNPGVEGFSGYNMAGLDVYQDAAIPTPGAGADQIIVLDPSAVLVFEGDLVPRVLPQTLGNQLSVLLQVYAYIAVLPLYPLAVQAISGTNLVAPTF
jgi:HK97 family phage major capsid protein